MTPELVAKALAEITTDAHRRTLTVAAILSAVAAYYGLTLESLQGAKRDRPLTVARQMAMYLLREELQSSWTQIGKELGNRDHSTILHGYQKIANDINTDAALRRDLVEIREGLYSKAV